MILIRLKSGTSAEHERIERAVPLLADDLDRATYGRYLEKLLGFYEPLEQALAPHPWHLVGIDFAARRKTELLVRDLCYLGYDEAALANVARCAALPPLPDLPAALGCLYVLEGSTLGGQILSRHVARRLGLSPATGAAFLAPYGKAVGPMWRTFSERLEAFPCDEATQDRMVESARATFHALERWLTRSSLALEEPQAAAPAL
ncbi:MAG TPA: biliverdin-producing heme oxygenase [Polyangia bacterium]|jgi:heme oxygenase|nr:biliverdin-producing heme oxygenase [Polyangia bacterium]